MVDSIFDKNNYHNEWEVRELAIALDDKEPQEVLRWGIERFGQRLAIGTSFQAAGMAILDMAWHIDPTVRVFTIDTGRLHQETYELMERVRERYHLTLEVYYPDAAELEAFVRREGINAFYRSVPLRLHCCQIRKVNPTKRALATLDAWVTGLRREPWVSRMNIPKVEIDHDHGGLLKLNPLADWTEEEVWAYIREHDVPYNALYDRGYRSIGCAPCTRPIGPQEEARAGRWWWEQNAPKECGIHCPIETGGFEHEAEVILGHDSKGGYSYEADGR
jgi:phosphoadenosine phosphosulfate reductase